MSGRPAASGDGSEGHFHQEFRKGQARHPNEVARDAGFVASIHLLANLAGRREGCLYVDDKERFLDDIVQCCPEFGEQAGGVLVGASELRLGVGLGCRSAGAVERCRGDQGTIPVVAYLPRDVDHPIDL